jgi:WD40 repeat protein
MWEAGIWYLHFPPPGADVMTFSFSPDGTMLASGHGDHNIRLWDVETGEIIHILKGHTGNVDSVAFSPDGLLLASGEANSGYTIKLWDAASGEEIAALTGHHENVYSLAFSPNGRLLASASGDPTVRL